MTEDRLFCVFDVPVVRWAKQSEVQPIDITEDTIVLAVDSQEVLIKKTQGGTVQLLCACEYCGRKGVASKNLCRRKIRAIDYLLRFN